MPAARPGRFAARTPGLSPARGLRPYSASVRARLAVPGLPELPARLHAREIDLDAAWAVVQRRDQIEAQLGEIGELLTIERVRDEVGGDQTNAAKPAVRTTHALELRQL